MPLDPNDPMLQEAMAPYANPMLAQRLQAAQSDQPATNPFQPAQPMIQSPNLLARNDTPNTPAAGEKLVSDADLSQLYGYKDLGPAPTPASTQPAGQADQSIGALQSALGGLGDAGGHVAASKTGAVPTGNVQLSAPQQVQAPQPDMSKVVTAGPGAGQVPGSGTPQPQTRTLPESWVNTENPTSRDERAAGEQYQLTGVDEETQAQRQASGEIAGIKERTIGGLGKFNDQAGEVQKQREGLYTHYDELAARRRLIGQERTDPEAWKKAGGPGRRIGMAIAMALGAAGASLGHTQNTAAEIINKDIDDRTRADEAALANRKEGVKDEMNLVEHKTNLLGDKEKGIAAAKQQHLADAMAEIDATTAKYQDPVIKARGEQLKGELMQHYADAGDRVNKYVPAQTVGVGSNAGTIRVPVGEQGQIIRLPDGRMAHVGDVKTAGMLNEMNARTELVHRLASQVNELDKNRMAHVRGTSEYNKLHQLRTDLAQTLTVQHEAAKGVGAIRGEEAAISGREVQGARGALADEGLWGAALGIAAPGRAVAAVNAAVKTADRLRDATFRSAPPLRIVTGGRPVTGHGGSAFEYDVTGDTYSPQAEAPAGARPGVRVGGQ